MVLDKHDNRFVLSILFHPDHLPGIANLKEFAIKLYAYWVLYPILSLFPPSHHIPGRAIFCQYVYTIYQKILDVISQTFSIRSSLLYEGLAKLFFCMALLSLTEAIVLLARVLAPLFLSSRS
jgi:hypothetical protein